MQTYRVGEFAARSGVSVRTLHHYDRIGLLKPTRRTDVGYRLYSDTDILRLQQIMTLRYLGFPLAHIRDLISGPEFDLVASINIQRTVMRDRLGQMLRIDESLEALLAHHRTTGTWDWSLAAGATAAAQDGLTAKGAVVNEYYTAEQMAEQFDLRAQELGVGERDKISQEWTQLVAEVRRSHEVDPASPDARSLLHRWDALVGATFGGNTKLAASVANGYRHGQYSAIEGTPTPEDFAFLQRVRDVLQL